LIYGAGGNGREVGWLVEEMARRDNSISMAGFIEDSSLLVGKQINGARVMSFEEACEKHSDHEFIVSMGNPTVRQKVTERCQKNGLRIAKLVAPDARLSPSASIGEGSIVCSGSIITVNVNIGKHVHVNIGCTVSHDVSMEDYATLAPGVHIAGAVELGRRAYVGIGATIINGTPEKRLRVGDDAVIGAGACVVRNVEAGATVVGVPAKPLRGR
jgi:sugar O-acyltransferase (sialic acid O-acetyltransferase NeuD family)